MGKGGKRQMICVVIVALGHEKIIRVAKNLRVCADCQMASSCLS